MSADTALPRGVPGNEAEPVSASGGRGAAAIGRALWASAISRAGLVLIGLFVLIALFAPWIAPHDPVAQNIMRMSQAPSADHWLGTDRFGRDILSRVIWGTRPSLALAFMGPLIAMTLGTLIGTLAGYLGGWVDRVVGRLTDTLMAFPSLLLGILVSAALGPGFFNVVAAVAFAFLPRFIRVARAATLALRQEPYVEAAVAVGQPAWRIIPRHVLPNISGPIVVVSTLWIATAIRVEATLSFLGLGVQAPSPSWGNIIRDGLGNLLSSPWPVVSAGLAITLCVLAFNLVGDALRDALDPEHREQ